MTKRISLMGYPGIPTHFSIGGGLMPAPEILELAANRHADDTGQGDVEEAWNGLSDDDRKTNVALEVAEQNRLADANAQAMDVTGTLIENLQQTLWGDLIDAALTEVKALPKPWQMMVADEQSAVLERITSRVKHAGTNLVRSLASRGQASIVCDLESVTVKKGAKATLEIPKSALDQDLLDAVGGPVLLVVASFEEIKAIQAPQPDPDQPDLLADSLAVHSDPRD